MWKKVLVSDESTVQQLIVQRYPVWMAAGTRLEETCTTPPVKHPPMGRDVLQGDSCTLFLPPGTTMNGETYVNLLKSKLDLHTRVHNCDIFMHDCAPCHRSKAVKNFLEQNRIQKIGAAMKQSGFESYRKHVELYEDVSEKHPSVLMNFKQQLKTFG